jgi:hypothetical protein
LCLRGLRRLGMPLRLPESRASADSFVPVRRGLQLRTDVYLRGLPARERTPVAESLTHADTGVLAVAGSVSMMLALVLACAWQQSGHHGS